ncbi:MAG: PIN domain-containing protein [Prevotellaceae bacterium]|jgi:predicted nucleic acid-binding protein|nr:PIN domain-containing protein [Prevotellaceae bacterium]
MNTVLIDTNVVIDFSLKREPFFEDAKNIFYKIHSKKVQAYISASAATDIFYLIRKAKGKALALEMLADLVAILEILDVHKSTILAAIKMEWGDFEDAVQAQVAMENNIEAIVTRDAKDFGRADSIKIISPHELA